MSAEWRAGTFPHNCETEPAWEVAQKRGVTWQQLSVSEREAVALDAIKRKVEAKTWDRPENWFDSQSGTWVVKAGFDDINGDIWRGRTC